MIYENTIGHQFSADFTIDGDVLDLTGATITLRLQPPAAAAVSDKSASTTATAGQAAYVTIDGDLTPAGAWRRQWIVETSGGSTYYSQIWDFRVLEAL